MEDKETKRKQKVAQAIKDKKIVDDSTFATFQMIEDLNERLDKEVPTLANLIDKVKGEKGDSPTKEELLKLIEPLIPEPIKPENGKDYVLTEEDKKDIAKTIKVPIVEKHTETIVEKTDVIHETPIVTENVVEKAVTDLPDVIIEKINTSKKIIKKERVEGLADIERIAKINAANFNPTMGPSFSDLANINKRIDNLPKNGGSGSVNGVTGLNTDNTDPTNPIIKISVDGSSITGQGTPSDPFVSHSSGSGAVDSVNSKTGVVVLNQDDIGDGATYKQYSATEKTKLAAISGSNTGDETTSTIKTKLGITTLSGSNTGDQDLSGKLDLHAKADTAGAADTAITLATGTDRTKLDAAVPNTRTVNTKALSSNIVLTPDDLDDTSTTHKFVAAADVAKLSNLSGTNTGDQTLSGLGAEAVANKATTFGTINDTLYPTVKAVNDAIVSAVAGLLDYRGAFNASTNLFPATGGSGLAGAILKGDFWVCSVAGTLGGTAVTAGDLIISLADTPGQTAGNWDLVEHDLGYAPENVANKVTSISGSSTDVQYPSAKLVYDQLATKQASGSYQPLATVLTNTTASYTTALDTKLGGIATAATANAKITGATLDALTDDTGFVTAKAIQDGHNVPHVAPGTNGNILTSNGTDWTSAAPAAAGSTFWTLLAGATRVSDTTFTVTGDQTALISKGMIIKWTVSSAVKVGMVSIPSTFSTTTTVTIVGDTMASIDASSLKYAQIGAEAFYERFAVAGNIGAIGTDIVNAFYAHEPMRVLGADLQVGTAGTTNSTTIDINIEGTTAFTTKPTLATTVAHSPTPFTADTAKSLALNDRVSIDIDAIQTTNAVDLYVKLYLFPTRYINLT